MCRTIVHAIQLKLLRLVTFRFIRHIHGGIGLLSASSTAFEPNTLPPAYIGNTLVVEEYHTSQAVSPAQMFGTFIPCAKDHRLLPGRRTSARPRHLIVVV